MIKIINLQKRFGKKVILENITMTCPTGKTTVVIGPSGCGKSTLLRLILRLIEPDGGELLINNDNILKYSTKKMDEIRQKIGMVFQSSALFDSLRVWENVGFSLLEHTTMSSGKIKAIASEKLKIVNLEGAEDLYPAELSGGMKKRVGIARALARDPQFIFYDEPTTGLDPVTSTIIEDLIKHVQQQTGATTVLVTHQLSTIFRTADIITMIYKGQVIESGSIEELKKSPNSILQEFLFNV